MKTVGIIAEYNPFHRGHQYQLDHARKTLSADYIIVAMSGDYVQRGVPALFPKHLRARMALLCGADLVLELPVSAATASAEFFASSGVSLLDGLGVTDMLCFGSEAGSVAPLQALAAVLLEEPPAYQEALRQALRSGMSFPLARSLALQSLPQCAQLPTGELLSSPNNILGLEYCKALLSLHSTIEPVALKREGFGYHDLRMDGEGSASASALRASIKAWQAQTAGAADTSRIADAKALAHTGVPQPQSAHAVTALLFEQLRPQIPPEIFPLFQESLTQGNFLLEEDFDSIFHYCLLSAAPENLRGIPDMSPSLAQRILNQRGDFLSLPQFSMLLKTKELTLTRVSRALLHMLLNIRQSPKELPYARVLGFRKSSTPLLAAIKEKGRIPLLTRPADAPRLLDDYGLALLEETTFASNVYQSLLCRKTKKSFVHEYEQRILIL